MSEAVPVPDPPPTPAADAAADTAAVSEPGLLLDIGDYFAGEIELMEDYVGDPVLPMIADLLEAVITSDGDPLAIMRAVPFKFLVSVRGIVRMRRDSAFGIDQWPTLKFRDLFPHATAAPNEDAAGQEPAAADGQEPAAADPPSPAPATGALPADQPAKPTPIARQRGKRVSKPNSDAS